VETVAGLHCKSPTTSSPEEHQDVATLINAVFSGLKGQGHDVSQS